MADFNTGLNAEQLIKALNAVQTINNEEPDENHNVDINVVAADVSYDNTESNLEAENAQDAIDEVVEKIEQTNTVVAGKANANDVTGLQAQVASNTSNINTINTTTTSLQNQINNIVTPVTVDAEVQNARVGSDGTSYTSLKDRLDGENTSLKADLSTLTDIPFLKWEVGKINAANHNPQSATDMIRTKPFLAISGQRIRITTNTSATTFFKAYFYNSSTIGTATYVSDANPLSTGAMHEFTAEENGLYVVICYMKESGWTADTTEGAKIVVENPADKINVQNIVKNSFLAPELLHGVTHGDNVFPQNICGVYNNQYIDGDGVLRNGEFISSAGTIKYNTVSGYFAMKSETTYRNVSTGDFTFISIAFYDDNFTYIGKSVNKPSRIDSDQALSTTPQGTAWARITYWNTTSVMITEGSSAWYKGVRPYESIYPTPIDYSVKPNSAFEAETASVVAEVMSDDMGELRFLHVADTHSGKGGIEDDRNMLYQSMIKTAKELSCDFILHTGDIIAGSTGDNADVWKQSLIAVKDVFKDCDIPVIVCRGNHDDNSVGIPSAAKVVDNTFWQNVMCKTLNEKCTMFTFPDSGDGGYYYYDIAHKKVRIVNINSEDLTDSARETTGGQNHAEVSQEQLDWLEDVAFVVPDGWRIICVSHISPDASQPNMGISNAGEVMALLDTFKDKIVAYVYGHTHVSVDYVNAQTGIQFLSTPTAGGSVVNYLQTGRNSSYPSATAKTAAATGAMLFNVNILNGREISRVRWGVEDDVFGD